MYRQSVNNFLSAINMSSTNLHNMANFGALIASCLRYCSDVAHRRPTKVCTIFGRFLCWYTIYTLSGALASWQKFGRCNIHFTSKSCVLLLLRSSRILAAWLHGTPVADVNQTLRRGYRGTRNGITELSRRALPIFCRAAITLGIGPHSSLNCDSHRPTRRFRRVVDVKA